MRMIKVRVGNSHFNPTFTRVPVPQKLKYSDMVYRAKELLGSLRPLKERLEWFRGAIGWATKTGKVNLPSIKEGQWMGQWLYLTIGDFEGKIEEEIGNASLTIDMWGYREPQKDKKIREEALQCGITRKFLGFSFAHKDEGKGAFYPCFWTKGIWLLAGSEHYPLHPEGVEAQCRAFEGNRLIPCGLAEGVERGCCVRFFDLAVATWGKRGIVGGYFNGPLSEVDPRVFFETGLGIDLKSADFVGYPSKKIEPGERVLNFEPRDRVYTHWTQYSGILHPSWTFEIPRGMDILFETELSQLRNYEATKEGILEGIYCNAQGIYSNPKLKSDIERFFYPQAIDRPPSRYQIPIEKLCFNVRYKLKTEIGDMCIYGEDGIATTHGVGGIFEFLGSSRAWDKYPRLCIGVIGVGFDEKVPVGDRINTLERVAEAIDQSWRMGERTKKRTLEDTIY